MALGMAFAFRQSLVVYNAGDPPIKEPTHQAIATIGAIAVFLLLFLAVGAPLKRRTHQGRS